MDTRADFSSSLVKEESGLVNRDDVSMLEFWERKYLATKMYVTLSYEKNRGRVGACGQNFLKHGAKQDSFF